MKFNKSIVLATLSSALFLNNVEVLAGNEDRAGSAGATELNVNPWARSMGWGDAGLSSVRGIESVFMNIAGLAYTKSTEIAFARTNWLGSATGIGLNSFGLAQRVGETGVIGISVMSMNYGDIQITTTELPEGGIGNYNPSSFNFGLSYAKQFSPTISGGMQLKVISQAISNVKSQGVSIDAGIRYVTGEKEQTKFAISLRNVGPPMKYQGDGLALEMINFATDLRITSVQRAASYELPSQLMVGGSYDFYFNEQHSLTLGGTFVANSFTRDQWRLGVEYKLTSKKADFYLRTGYAYESNIFNPENRATAITGLTGGMSVDFNAGESGSKIGIDYGVRTCALGIIHTVGATIKLGDSSSK
jgi:hypothetical protein